MDGYYEHHIAIKQDKLCPFSIRKLYNMKNARCNWHDNLELLLVIEGDGLIQYGKKTIKLFAGDIIIVNSGVMHGLYSKRGLGCYLIIIDENFCRENGINTASLYFKEQVRDRETEKLFLTVAKIADEFKTSSELLCVARLRAAILNLLVDISSKYAEYKSHEVEEHTRSEEYVKAVIEYLNENYCKPVSLDKLASFCGITKFHLSREFKRLTGQTILTYTNFLRCKKAEMLLSDGKSVTEAALESGFGSLSYFSRTYKKLMHTSPSKSGNK